MNIKVLSIERRFELQTVMRAVTISSPRIESVGFYSSADAASDGIITSSPDVILIDYGTTNRNGIECVPRIRTVAPKVSIIMAGKVLGMDLLLEAVAAGISGFLLMPLDARTCAAAIEEVHRGGVAFPTTALRLMMRILQGTAHLPASAEESQSASSTHSCDLAHDAVGR